jgi:hypothetical protein
MGGHIPWSLAGPRRVRADPPPNHRTSRHARHRGAGGANDIPGPHAHGYLAYRHEGELTVVDVTESSPTRYGAAGSIISTTADLDTFLVALVTGRLLPPPFLDDMLTFVPPPPGPGVSVGLFRKGSARAAPASAISAAFRDSCVTCTAPRTAPPAW